MSSPDAEANARAMKAMMGMIRIDIQRLKDAFTGL